MLGGAPDSPQWLSPDETQRLTCIRAPHRRRQFLAGRWLTRRALAHRHGGTPEDWWLDSPSDAPPAVLRGPIACPSSINLTHSGDTVACVLADAALGIDVEQHDRRVMNTAELAQATLNFAEYQWWSALPAVTQNTEFLSWWTLKEAWIKAHGQSLAPATLRAIEALPTTAKAANARVWRTSDFTLALVGLAASEPLEVAEPGFSGAVQWWQVGSVAD